jgi:hypothetical protein
MFIYISDGCKINENCYLCLGFTSEFNDEFSVKKFNQIKKGYTRKQVEQDIGQPITIFGSPKYVNPDSVKYTAWYNMEYDYNIFDGWVAFIVVYDKNYNVISAEKTFMD